MKIPLVILAAILSIIGGACGRKASSEDEGGENIKATVAVRTTSLRRGDMATVVQATGRIDALRKEKLLSPVAGKITSVRALEGASVNAGEVLAVVLTRESQAAIAGAEALLRSAKTSEQKAEAQRALDMARSSENSVLIRSTFSGTVSTRSISEGELVAENAELFTLIDFSTLVFVADVPARDLPSLAVGQRCSVSLASMPGKGLQMEVEAINPQIDVMSQTLKVRLKILPKAGGLIRLLKTDMIGTASIITGVQRGVFIVPKPAVLRNDETNTYSVVTFTSDSLALTLPVEVKAMTDSTVAIANHSLKDGMNIIIEGHYALADSTRVTVVQ